MAHVDITPPVGSGNNVPSRSYVYAIAAGDEAVKIGRAKDPQNRLKDLQTSHHQTLTLLHTEECRISEAGAVEREAHHLLRRYRLHGEWFRVPKDYALSAICQALDIVRINANLGGPAKTPRTDAAERLVRKMPEHAREECAWNFARQIEVELREVRRQIKDSRV